MNIEDILKALPSREDLAAVVGIERKAASPAEVLTVLGAGMLLGAGLAVLLAPKNGKDLRHSIAETLGDFAEQIRPSAPAPDSPPTTTAAATSA
jgi:hypothetical protein